MSTVMFFEQEEKVRIVCQCGTMEGKAEPMAWGLRVFFECRDCDTSVSMEVTK